jgi:hypothetical protein|tara:strand:+ start:2039 stop:2491 length:453 start_codon:yes stop_codon:yes gene_type:complete
MTDKPKRNPKGSGRKRIIIKPEAVEQLAAQGLGPTQIARALGVSWGVIDRNRKRSKEFNDALKNGRAKGLAKVTNSLFKSANGGNVTAQIFYLKNRDESNWRDRVETTTNHQISLSQVLDSAKKRVINITPEPKRVNKSSINQGKQGDDK